ncbi:MAG: hypothetical protein KJ914_02810 [Gammaproteobacteria bacterium]|nr:hypothetical protein [Gammaproteobacteria bacterium]MBU1725616.1 hypothetical protein [Gammaproteobacteria bacterium]MBU2004032.1 hypothetical protein [Gammaproteobacteria bacterium]
MSEQEYQHPSEYAPDLKQEYLVELCNEILNVVEQALVTAGTEHDTAWTRGTLAYGRVQGFFQKLQKSHSKPWVTLANKTMDFTFKVGNTYVQFVMDDPFAPKKIHRLKANSIEQMSLELEPEPDVVAWRLFVDRNYDDEFLGLNAVLVGFDINQNPVCIWRHDEVASIPMKTGDKPAEVFIEDAPLQRRTSQSKPADDGLKHEAAN